jgi:2-succinyl-5-enolpyruvyl-6-hydroxy-3-cyclohexene-1-carboxylate synthase
VVSRALLSATGALSGDPGPVQLNLSFRDPLLPDGEVAALADPWTGRDDGGPWTAGSAPRTPVEPLPDGPRTLVVAGDGAPETGRAWAAGAVAAGWPVVAEPSGGAWSGDAVRGGALLLGVPDWLDAHRPERVVVVGRPTLARPVSALLADPRVRVETVTATGRWPDAGRSSALATRAAPPVGPPADPAWISAWADAAGRVGAAVDALLDDAPGLTAARLARDLVAALPAGALLVLGSSTPVRDVDRLAVPRGDLTVLANRGVAGIDGTVSTAIGAALVHGGPAVALMGDLTFLHDLQGLLTGDGETRPDLTVVVPDNDGGGIFAQLEPGRPAYARDYRRVFGTPHGRDLVAVAQGLGWAATRVTSAGELPAALAAGGPRVVVVRTDPGAEAELATALRDASAKFLV